MSEIILALAGRAVAGVLRRLPFSVLARLEANAGATSLWGSVVATAFVLKGTARARRSAPRATRERTPGSVAATERV